MLQSIFFTTFAMVKVKKNLPYADAGDANMLDVYYNSNQKNTKDVIVFIHGGSWNSGSKNTYWFLGRNFAKKGILMVAINYSLSPLSNYENMAFDCSKAIKWVKENISKYGGNPERIFVMGHSAGGHLAALINQNPIYFEKIGIQNPIKGVILNDPFGLDIHQYMKLQINTNDKYIPGFLKVFSHDEKNWIAASPVFTVNNIANPYLLFIGGNTYESIKIQTPAFYQKLKENHKLVHFEEIKNKKHVAMISHMIFGWNQLYAKIISFMSDC
jgi:acetyl esterase/lipase